MENSQNLTLRLKETKSYIYCFSFIVQITSYLKKKNVLYIPTFKMQTLRAISGRVLGRECERNHVETVIASMYLKLS